MVYRVKLLLVCIIVLIGATAWAEPSQNPKESVFFSQGQSLYNANDLAKTRTQALQDLFEQAITQAAGTLVEPSRMEKIYPAFRSHIVSKAESYIRNYKILSESPDSGIYKIRGQASVSMDLLAKDLEKVEAIGLQSNADQVPSVAPGPKSEKPLPNPSLPVFKKKLLWVVPEKWDDHWSLPQDGESEMSFFAASILHESQNHNCMLVFPDDGSLVVDAHGNVSPEQALESAEALGIQAVALGSVVLEKRNDHLFLKAAIRIVDTATKQPLGEVQQQWSITDSKQEGAMELAALTAPQIETLLLDARVQSKTQAPIVPSAQVSANQMPELPITRAQPLTLVVHSYRHYANWAELEKALRDTYQTIKISSVEMEPDQIRAYLEGVDSQLPNVLKSVQLRSGCEIKIGAYSAENHSLDITIEPGGAVPRQE